MPYTTTELITAVRDEFGEDTPSPSGVSDVQILGFLNKRQREMCMRSDVLLTCHDVETKNGQETYATPPEYLKVSAVFIYRANGLQRRLDPMEMPWRDATKRTSADQHHFYIWGANDTTGNNTPLIGLQDIPNADSATKDLNVYHRQAPKVMVSGGQAPEVNFAFQDGLIQGALASIYSRLSTVDSKWLSLYDRKMSEWRDWMVEAGKFVNPLILDLPGSRVDSSLNTYEYDYE